jgi:hypothetical protein
VYITPIYDIKNIYVINIYSTHPEYSIYRNGDGDEIPMRSVADKRRKTSNQKLYRQ